MESLRAAAALLSSANDIKSVRPILVELGFGTPEPLDASIKLALKIPSEVAGGAELAAGPGPLRALLLADKTSQPAHELVSKICKLVSGQSPHLLWLVTLVRDTTNELVIAACNTQESRPKIFALVANRNGIVDSDAETFCAMCAATSNDGLATYARWIELLGRDGITRRFYRTMEQLITNMGQDNPVRKDIALLYVTRMLFLSFLETKGWLNRDFGFLVGSFAECMGSTGSYQRKVLEPLFFGTLNTRAYKRSERAHEFGKIPFLNGGLFARTPLEKRNRHIVFSDEEMGTIFGDLLTRYRFTAREDTSDWGEAAVDPEMLGKAFESLMESQERKKSGAFYTPQQLVERVSDYALNKALDADVNEVPNSYQEKVRLLDATRNIRILDPACGSGAFLVHVLERLSDLRCRLLNSNTKIHAVRREVLMSSIYGVDVNPTAVWLCELRLWLSVVINNPERDPMRVLPLPNLDRNVRIGDSLSGGDFDKSAIPVKRHIKLARERYTRATGTRKKTLSRSLDHEERRLAILELDNKLSSLQHQRKEIICTARSHDLFGRRGTVPALLRKHLDDVKSRIKETRSLKNSVQNGAALPFTYSAHFAEAHAAGGFDVIVGNPPWVRLHNIMPHNRLAFRREFTVFRDAAWIDGAKQAHAGKGFAAQVDMSALFVERSLKLLKTEGVMSLLLPSKLWHSLAGGGVRTLLKDQTQLLALHELHETGTVSGNEGNDNGAGGFDAAVYPSIIVARKVTCDVPECLDCNVNVIESNGFNVKPSRLALSDSPGSPWIIIPPGVRDSFDAITGSGTPLCLSHIGRPLSGVKAGCNDAFVVKVTDVHHELAVVQSYETAGVVERDVLRPLLRGTSTTEWRARQGNGSNDYMIWTHDTRGKPLDKLPSNAHKWLKQWHSQLTGRTDMRGNMPWWSLFRIDAATNVNARVVWSDIGKRPRALILPVGDRAVPLNSCYVARCNDMNDAFALAALLNSPLTAAWLNIIAEPARGGYRRYIGWTVGLLPIPHNWSEARRELANLGCRGYEGDPPSQDELLHATLRAYGVSITKVEPLLQWNS